MGIEDSTSLCATRVGKPRPPQWWDGTLRRFGVWPWLLLLLAGCVTQQPRTDLGDAARQLPATVTAWPNDASDAESATSATTTRYLDELIVSPTLQTWVVEGLAANPALEQTRLALLTTQAQLRIADAARLPVVDAGISAADDENGGDSYSRSITVSWALDVWGRLSDLSQAAGHDLAAQTALYLSARDLLASEIMQSWLIAIYYAHAIEIEQQRLSTLERNAGFIVQRYRSGLGTLEDLDGARSSSASSRATLEEYHERLTSQLRALRRLLGRIDGEPVDMQQFMTAAYPDVALPQLTGATQTLAGRPDLQAAYSAIQAAERRSVAAYKDLLPNLDVSAALTSLSDTASVSLFDDPVWSVLGQLTAPLFHGGELRAAVDVAEQSTLSAYQAYRETLLTAVTEVGDLVSQEKSLARRQQHVDAALASAQSNLTHYQQSYRAGLVTILELLEVQRQTFDLQAQHDNLQYLRLSNRIDLGLALGLTVSPRLVAASQLRQSAELEQTASVAATRRAGAAE